jgi:hypothetical protein
MIITVFHIETIWMHLFWACTLSTDGHINVTPPPRESTIAGLGAWRPFSPRLQGAITIAASCVAILSLSIRVASFTAILGLDYDMAIAELSTSTTFCSAFAEIRP